MYCLGGNLNPRFRSLGITAIQVLFHKQIGITSPKEPITWKREMYLRKEDVSVIWVLMSNFKKKLN